MTQSELLTVVGITVTVLLFLLSLLLGIIGFLINRQLSAISAELAVLPRLQTSVAEVKVVVDQHSTTLAETSQRLSRVEEHVNNTERIAVLERDMRALNVLADKNQMEIDKLRSAVHVIPTQLQALTSRMDMVQQLLAPQPFSPKEKA